MKFKENGADTKNFLRLKDKESVVGVLRGELYDFRQHWVGKEPVLCPGATSCGLCAKGDKSKFRFRVNMVFKEGDNYVAKIFEQGWTVYDAMRALNSEYDLEKTIVKITRSGSGLNDTSYSIIPIKESALDPEKEKVIASVKLLPLADNPTEDFVPSPAFNSDEEIPF